MITFRRILAYLFSRSRGRWSSIGHTGMASVSSYVSPVDWVAASAAA